jgi:hypothetical protein
VVGKHIAQSKTPCWSRAPGNPCSIISGGGKWIDLTIEADPIYHTIPVAAEKAFCPAVKTGENQPWRTIALNQGITGEKYSAFITGTASTAGTKQIELRVKEGAGLSKKDVYLALKSFERFFENTQQVSAAGFSVSG